MNEFRNREIEFWKSRDRWDRHDTIVFTSLLMILIGGLLLVWSV